MEDAIDKAGFEAARETYFGLRDREGDRFDLAESQLNDLGYALIRRE